MKEFQYLMLQDGYFFQKSSKNHEVHKEELPFSIFQDGEVVDYHHFLYIIKKFFKEKGIDEKSKILLLIDSSQIQHINYRLPKVEERDLREFLRIELEDSYNIVLSDYEMIYDSFPMSEEIHLSIELIPKSITEPLRKVFDNMGSEIMNIFPKYSIYPLGESYCNIGFTNIHLIKKQEEFSFQSQSLRDKEILKFYQLQKVESSNVWRLLTGRYELMSGEVHEDFERIVNNLFSFLCSKALSQLQEDSFVLTGPLAECSMARGLIDSGKGKEELEENFFKNYHYLQKIKKIYPWKKILLLFVILVLLGGNFWYYQYLKGQRDDLRNQQEKSISVTTSTEDMEVTHSSDRHQEKNLLFLKKIKEIQDRESERIMFTDYSYQGNQLIVQGILRQKEDIQLLKDFPIQSQSITKERGIYKFKLEIENS